MVTGVSFQGKIVVFGGNFFDNLIALTFNEEGKLIKQVESRKKEFINLLREGSFLVQGRKLYAMKFEFKPVGWKMFTFNGKKWS